MSNGFTLIELILVVVVIAIVAVMSTPIYSRFLLQNAVANTTDQMVGSLRKAQIYAVTGKQGSAWSVNYSSNTITLYKGTTFSGHDSSFDETFSVNPNVSIAGMTDINFARVTGLPAPSTGATITVSSSGNNQATITVNTQGVTSR